MGLDMYAYKVEKGLIPEGVEVDFYLPENEEYVEEDWYWRKNNYLHGWMDELYRAKGGKDPDFNGNTVKLTEEDLKNLRTAIKNKTLTRTFGFFFGSDYNYYGEEYGSDRDLKFVEEALEAINDGMDVYYDSSW
jgi:hypothetical protein